MVAKISSALVGFDDLPDAALVPDKVVAGVFGMSIPSVWRMSKDGRLPAPIHTGTRMTRWRVGALREVLAAAR